VESGQKLYVLCAAIIGKLILQQKYRYHVVFSKEIQKAFFSSLSGAGILAIAPGPQ